MEHLQTLTGLKPNVLWAYVWLFWLHVAVTAAPAVIRLVRPQARFGDYMKRALGWWVVSGSVLLALLGGRETSILFLAWVSLLALKELLAIMVPGLTRRTRMAVLTLALGHYGLVWLGEMTPFLILLPVGGTMFLLVWMMAAEPVENFLRNVGGTSIALFLAVFCLSHLAFLVTLPEDLNPVGGSVGLFLFVLFIAQFNDLAQYVWGKIAGRHPIVPTISPQKTWEGFVGGLLTTAATAWLLAPYLTPFAREWALLVGALIAAGGFLGDITVSAIKRDAGVKDTGRILPGFGGVMDRVDSLVLVAPAFLYLLRYSHL